MAKSQEIEIWTTVAASDTKAALPALGKTRFEVSRVQLSAVSKNLTEFLTEFQAVFEIPADSKSGFYVDEIELNLGVSGSGGIALFGKLEAGVEAGMKVKLKRQKPSP